MDKIKKRRKKTGSVLIALLALVTYFHILKLSSKPGETSSQQSESLSALIIGFFEKILKTDFDLTGNQFLQFEGFIRKAAHFTEYALLGFLVYSLFLLWGRSDVKAAVRSFLLVVGLASFDEFLQIFIPERFAMVKDVIIDSIGCLAGMLMIRLIYFIYVSRKAKADVSQEKLPL